MRGELGESDRGAEGIGKFSVTAFDNKNLASWKASLRMAFESQIFLKSIADLFSLQVASLYSGSNTAAGVLDSVNLPADSSGRSLGREVR